MTLQKGHMYHHQVRLGITLIIFLTLQNLAMNSAGISEWLLKQEDLVAAYYWEN